MAHLVEISLFLFHYIEFARYIRIEKHAREESRVLIRFDHKEVPFDVTGCENKV